jgi:hypothetical protein
MFPYGWTHFFDELVRNRRQHTDPYRMPITRFPSLGQVQVRFGDHHLLKLGSLPLIDPEDVAAFGTPSKSRILVYVVLCG